MRNLIKSGLLVVLALSAALSAPAMAAAKDCPPGLAKKAVPCVPPGQVKVWTKGAILPENVIWQRLDDWRRLGLPRPGAGEAYVRVDDEVLLLGLATRVVLQSFGILN